MTEPEELTEDDIYDDGLSITNKVAVDGIKSYFESTPETGPKPKVPTKPGNKNPPCLLPRNNANKSPAMNGGAGVPVLPAKSNFMRDGTSDTSANHIPKRNSKVNIPDIFANADDSPKQSPKPPVKPVTPLKPKANAAPWSQRNKDSDVKSNVEHSKDETSTNNKVTPKPPDKPWANRQRQVFENEATPEKPPGKLTWSQRQALLKAESATDSGDKLSPKSPNQFKNEMTSPKSPNLEKKEESSDHPPKKRPSVLDKYGIQEKLINPVGMSPKPVLPVSPKIEEKEAPEEKLENEVQSPKRIQGGATPFAGITSVSNLESLKGKLRHVGPKTASDTKTGESVNFRKKSDDATTSAQRKSIIRKSLTRHVDGLKFYIVDFEDKRFTRPPPKPKKITEKIDLDNIIADHQASLADLANDQSALKNQVTEEDEELYEPIPADEDVPMRTSVSRTSRAVSLIQPMTEDEEFDSQEEYEDCDVSRKPPVPNAPLPELPSSSPPARPPKSKPPSVPTEDTIQEEYQDCESAPQMDEELEQDDVYEPLDDLNDIQEQKPVEEEIKKDVKVEEKKDDKLSEKERKKREKEEQKRMKEEKKKQEKELKELKSKFKVEPFQLENTQGEGNVRKDSKGGKLDLQVKAGQRVVLIRLVNNPAGKWLVKLKVEGKVGYVDANNVEVMEGSYVNVHQLSSNPSTSSVNDLEQEEYADADVEQEEYADVDGVEPIQDDLYEAC